jgi:hypothetical protein
MKAFVSAGKPSQTWFERHFRLAGGDRASVLGKRKHINWAARFFCTICA